MSSDILQTRYEVFTFFQSLRARALNTSTFSVVADELRKNKFINGSEGYSADRLSAENLESLYLKLLKDEIRRERNTRISPLHNGERSPRKRKLSTPPLQNAEEAAEHIHLLPQLIDRLYLQYRDDAVESIEKDEKEYKRLEQDIGEIESGEWDDRLKTEKELKKSQSRETPSVQNVPQEFAGASKSDEKSQQTPVTNIVTNIEGNHAGEHGGKTAQQSEKVQAPASGVPGNTNVSHSRTPSTAEAAPSFSPRHESNQTASKPPSQRQSAEPHVVQPARGYNGASPLSEAFRRLPPPQPQPGTSPRIGQLQQVTPESSSTSPIILPPPPGMLPSNMSPVMGREGYHDMSGQQYRPSASPRQGSIPMNQHPPTLPQPRNLNARAYQYYEHHGQPPYTPAFTPYGQPLAPVYPQSQPGTPHYPPQQSLPPHMRGGVYQGQIQYAPYSAPPNQHMYYPPHPAAAPPMQQRIVPSSVTTPTQRVLKKGPARPTPIDTSVSSTKWKKTPQQGSGATQKSPVRPERSPFLPSSPSEMDDSGLDDMELDNSSRRPTTAEETEDTPSRGSGPRRGRGGRGRGSARFSRGGATPAQVGSKGSRTRSQSITSQVDQASDIKPEPYATPAAIIDDTAEDSAHTTGRRRDTIRSIETPQDIRTGIKRKRGNTIDETPEPQIPSIPTRPNHILVSRNFPRTVGPLMHDITTHKLANMFAKPITEKDAPGYSNLIYRPQDLKSIKAAISAGSKAVAAAVEAMATAEDSSDATNASSGKASGILWLERSEYLEPPKAIVNSAQLEREITRMFANAVMFNPDTKRGLGPAFRTRARVRHTRASRRANDGRDDDTRVEEDDESGGFVKDAREMFDTVEKSVAQFRSAERVNEWERIGMEERERARSAQKKELEAEEEGDGDTEMAVADESVVDDNVEEENVADTGTVRRRRRM